MRKYTILTFVPIVLSLNAAWAVPYEGSLSVNGAGDWVNSSLLIDPGPIQFDPAPVGSGDPIALRGWVDLRGAPVSQPGGGAKFYFWFELVDAQNRRLQVTFTTDNLGGWHGIPAQPWDRVRYEYWTANDSYWASIYGANTLVGGPELWFSTQGGMRDDGGGYVYPTDRTYLFQSIFTPGQNTWDLWVYGLGRDGPDKQWYHIGQWENGIDQAGGDDMRINYNNVKLRAVLWGSPDLASGQTATVSWRNLEIGPVSWSVPDGGSTLGCLALALLGLFGLARAKSR